jgi:hypothetical protein
MSAGGSAWRGRGQCTEWLKECAVILPDTTATNLGGVYSSLITQVRPLEITLVGSMAPAQREFRLRRSSPLSNPTNRLTNMLPSMPNILTLRKNSCANAKKVARLCRQKRSTSSPSKQPSSMQPDVKVMMVETQDNEPLGFLR